MIVRDLQETRVSFRKSMTLKIFPPFDRALIKRISITKCRKKQQKYKNTETISITLKELFNHFDLSGQTMNLNSASIRKKVNAIKSIRSILNSFAIRKDEKTYMTSQANKIQFVSTK